jgi:hypothetical protein
MKGRRVHAAKELLARVHFFISIKNLWSGVDFVIVARRMGGERKTAIHDKEE